MEVFINIKAKRYSGDNSRCWLEGDCARDAIINPKEAMFAVRRMSPDPPYDQLLTMWFHPECFLIWGLESLADKRPLDNSAVRLLEVLREERLTLG